MVIKRKIFKVASSTPLHITGFKNPVRDGILVEKNSKLKLKPRRDEIFY
jgi:hypothetical protein